MTLQQTGKLLASATIAGILKYGHNKFNFSAFKSSVDTATKEILGL